MRIVGSILLILSGLLLGLAQARKLRKREAELLELKKLIQRWKAEIAYTSGSLRDLILGSGESQLCRSAMEDPDFQENPQAALLHAGETMDWKKEDAGIYRDFVSGIGMSDTEGQLEHLDLCTELLNQNLSDAREEVEKRSHLFVMLGLLGGVALCLILL